MNKTVLSLILSLLSGSVMAIENGTPVDWSNDFDDVVNNNCTGLIIGGGAILTAAHCPNIDGIQFANGEVFSASERTIHPDYQYSSSRHLYDVAVWRLPQSAKTQNIHFLADLNTPSVAVGETLTAYGFGGNNPLAFMSVVIDRLPSNIFTTFDGTSQGGKSAPGDSGGMWLKSDAVVAIHYGSGSDFNVSGTDLTFAKDFILEQIDGWHYPTVLKGTGTQTIKVQSLHQNSVVNAAYVAGGVTITGGTCQTLPAIDAFDTCTYELDVTGSGQLYLTTNEVIDINPVPPTPEPEDNTSNDSGSSSRGSLGVFSLLGLAVFGRLRKR